MIEHLNGPLDKLPINIHGVLIETIIEVVGQLLFLSLAVSGIAEIVFVERVFEDILWFDHIYRGRPFALLLLHSIFAIKIFKL
jgi:hypothetical protein